MFLWTKKIFYSDTQYKSWNWGKNYLLSLRMWWINYSRWPGGVRLLLINNNGVIGIISIDSCENLVNNRFNNISNTLSVRKYLEDWWQKKIYTSFPKKWYVQSFCHTLTHKIFNMTSNRFRSATSIIYRNWWTIVAYLDLFNAWFDIFLLCRIQVLVI